MLRLEYLKTLLSYDPDNGVLIWLKDTPHRINGITPRKGKIAGRSGGISIDGQYYTTKRIAWYLYYGELPASQIKHLDDDKHNIRIKNMVDLGAGRRKCTTCNVEGGKELFYADNRNASGLRATCKKCCDERSANYKKLNPGKPMKYKPPKIKPVNPVIMPPIVRRSLGME